MSDLEAAADQIVSEGRNARHSWHTVLAALTYAEDSDVNEATRRLRALKKKGAPPRWLVSRWAEDAGLRKKRNGHAGGPHVRP